MFPKVGGKGWRNLGEKKFFAENLGEKKFLCRKLRRKRKIQKIFPKFPYIFDF